MSDKKHQTETFSNKDQPISSPSRSASSSSTTTTSSSAHFSSPSPDSKSVQTSLHYNSIFNSNRNGPGQLLAEFLPAQSLQQLSNTNQDNKQIFGNELKSRYLLEKLGPNMGLLLSKSPYKTLAQAYEWHIQKIAEIKATYPTSNPSVNPIDHDEYESDDEKGPSDSYIMPATVNDDEIYGGKGQRQPKGIDKVYDNQNKKKSASMTYGSGHDHKLFKPYSADLSEINKELSRRSTHYQWLLNTLYNHPEYHIHALLNEQQFFSLIKDLSDFSLFFLPYKEGCDPQPIGHRIMRFYLNSTNFYRADALFLSNLICQHPEYSNEVLTIIKTSTDEIFKSKISNSPELTFISKNSMFPEHQGIAKKMLEAAHENQKAKENLTSAPTVTPTPPTKASEIMTEEPTFFTCKIL